jgi:nucleoside-diphosphate kinase
MQIQHTERSLIIVKPDGVARNLIGKILSRFEQKGFQLIATKFMMATSELLSKHYVEHINRDYYSAIEYSMLIGPIFIFVVEGCEGTVKFIRKMLGKTDPMESELGTIRGDLSIEKNCNICHASDSIESANREINIWFKPEELVSYVRCNHNLYYGKI